MKQSARSLQRRPLPSQGERETLLRSRSSALPPVPWDKVAMIPVTLFLRYAGNPRAVLRNAGRVALAEYEYLGNKVTQGACKA